jgi:hypothetical protein
MLRYLFKPFKIRRFSRESYLYTDKQKRRAEVVVYEIPGSSPRYLIDDLALTHWLEPANAELTPADKTDVLRRVREHLGDSATMESARSKA